MAIQCHGGTNCTQWQIKNGIINRILCVSLKHKTCYKLHIIKQRHKNLLENRGWQHFDKNVNVTPVHIFLPEGNQCLWKHSRQECLWKWKHSRQEFITLQLYFLLYSQISSQVIGMHCSGLQSPFFQCLTVSSVKELRTTFYTSS